MSTFDPTPYNKMAVCNLCGQAHVFGEPHNCLREKEYGRVAAAQGQGPVGSEPEHQGNDPGWAPPSPSYRGSPAGSGAQAGAPRSFEEAFAIIFHEAFDLLVERQRKYGPENVRMLGLYGVFSRLAYDKVERLRMCMNGTVTRGKVAIHIEDFPDETVDDSLLDIANYAFIMLALRRGVWGLPLEEE